MLKIMYFCSYASQKKVYIRKKCMFFWFHFLFLLSIWLLNYLEHKIQYIALPMLKCTTWSSNSFMSNFWTSLCFLSCVYNLYKRTMKTRNYQWANKPCPQNWLSFLNSGPCFFTRFWWVNAYLHIKNIYITQ
jgi:hypothetical protein